MKKSLLFLPIVTLVLLLSVFTVTAPAQEIFHIGDLVEVQDGSSWIQGRIESVQGSIAKVRTGNAKYDFINVQLPTTRFRRPGSAAREAKENQLQEAFAAEALDKYFRSVQMFAPFYDEEYISAGAPTTAAGWNEVVAHLAEVDVLCKGKYAGVTNAKWLVRKDLKYRYADWCQIAARRKELEPKFRAAAAKHMIGLTNTEDNLKFAFEHQKNRVPDETQMLMYDRARWKQQQTPKYQPRFAEYGIEMPADFFAEVEKKADELKQLVEQTAPNRSWEPPSFHDPAVEGFIRARFAADPDYRGVKIFKSGVDYKTWVVRKGLSYLGSDSTYRYYKVEYNSYKRGWVLMKLPNQPFCQASEWIVGRGAKGMVVVSLGGSGIFMKCQ